MAASRIRTAAVAGTFYPANADQLRDQVTGYLDAARERAPEVEAEAPPKALIVPHAGFIYSGPVAASAYMRLRRSAGRLKRVVLLGPAHRAMLRGLAASRADAFETPLGLVPIDRGAVDRALELESVRVHDEAHADEHSLEVQLPFLQLLLGDFALVPFAVGDAQSDDVARVLQELWGGDETLIVISSDLSHYESYETARQMDAASSRAIENLEPGGLDEDSACGRIPVRGLLMAAKQHGLACHTVDLRNSGDTAGGRDRVVGYGAYVLSDDSQHGVAA